MRIFMALIVAPILMAAASPDEFAILTGVEADKVLKPCSRSAPKDVDGTWTPTAEQVRALENRFEKCLAHPVLMSLSKYSRQYVGLKREDTRTIYLNAVRHESKATASKTAQILCDGGSKSFGVEFDPVDQLFNSFEFNSSLAGLPEGKIEYKCGPELEKAKVEATSFPIAKLKKIDPIDRESKAGLCANYSDDRWEVTSNSTGDVEISLLNATRQQFWSSLQVADTLFLSRDMGEWGGLLKVVSKEQNETIFRGNISLLFQRSPESVVAIGGLAHMMSNRGYLLEIEKSGGLWKVTREIRLEAAPEAALQRDNQIYIVQLGNLSVLDLKTWKVSKLSSLSNWGLAASSVAIDRSGDIFVGMRYAVARLRKVGSSKYSEKWLVKRVCKSTEGLNSVYE